MKVFCPQCGAECDDSIKFCGKCGFNLIPYIETLQKHRQEKENADAQKESVQNDTEVNEPVTETAAETTAEDSGPCDAEPIKFEEEQAKNKKEKKKKEKNGKNGKKKRLPWILRFLIANVIIAATLFVLWWGFGNMITLQLHTDKVVETLNSGSLELEGMENAYDELPDYIKDMMDDSSFGNDYGPITTAMLPHIKVERVKINGLFNGSTVEYKITAPDLKTWLLNLDATQIKNENDMLAKLQEYIPNAPERSVNVTVTYSRKNLFSINWRGNYYTREFSDAICGGFNSAYNVLYEQAMKELMEALEI